MKLRSYLIALVLVVMVPLLALAVAATAWTAAAYREAAETDLQNTTRALSLAIEKEVEAVRAALFSLAASPALENADLAAFYKHARVVGEASGTWVALVDRVGQELMTTQLPFGSTLPLPHSTDSRSSLGSSRRACRSSATWSSVGSANKPIFGVDVPVVREGRVPLCARHALGPRAPVAASRAARGFGPPLRHIMGRQRQGPGPQPRCRPISGPATARKKGGSGARRHQGHELWRARMR